MGSAVSRSGLDKHVGHLSPTPNPFHQTAYTGGSSNVKTNGAKLILMNLKAGYKKRVSGAYFN